MLHIHVEMILPIMVMKCKFFLWNVHKQPSSDYVHHGYSCVKASATLFNPSLEQSNMRMSWLKKIY
jgi:hypothetical protein